jgi:hypothetical protein
VAEPAWCDQDSPPVAGKRSNLPDRPDASQQ